VAQSEWMEKQGVWYFSHSLARSWLRTESCQMIASCTSVRSGTMFFLRALRTILWARSDIVRYLGSCPVASTIHLSEGGSVRRKNSRLALNWLVPAKSFGGVDFFHHLVDGVHVEWICVGGSPYGCLRIPILNECARRIRGGHGRLEDGCGEESGSSCSAWRGR
jgi:hypothetical protein